jgi:hypothetical protein
MRKSFLTITAAVAILSAASLVSNRAEAGASASAPMKISKATQTATVPPVRTGRHVRRDTFGITEYSSSSATDHPPKR